MTWLATLLPGLLLGIALERIGLADLHTARRTFALRTGGARALPAALGFGMMLCALLCWLAVIDTDLLPILPLNGSVLLGGVVAGLALGLTGCTPGTCLAALGGGRFLPALCGVLGVISGAAIFTFAGDALSFADSLLPESTTTLFRVTLTQPYLVDGRFLGLGCLGLFIVAVTLLFPHSTPTHVTPAPKAETPVPPPSTAPDAVQEEAFVSLLPEEEPLVVDTVETDQPPEEDAPPSEAADPDAVSLGPGDPPADAGVVSDLPQPQEDSPDTAALPADEAGEAISPILPPPPDDIVPDNRDDKEELSMSNIRPADPVTPGMVPAPASADPETGVSPVPVVLPARKVHKRKPTGTRKRRD